MIISKSNVAKQSTIAIVPASAIQDISVVVDGDFSSNYIDSLPSQSVVTFTFATPQNIEYVSFGGTNVAQKSSVNIETSAGQFNYDGDLSKIDSSVLLYTAQSGDHSVVTSVTVTIEGSGQLAITEIAMGEIIEVPNGGEQAGYNRAWTVPNVQVRSSTNLDGAPINASIEARSISCTLTVPTYIMATYEDDWAAMLRFASRKTFYIKEDAVATHSYAGFNLKPAMVTANASTRLLGGVSMQFNAYAKAVQV